MYPKDRKYSKEHEWVLLEDDGRALVGITEYAQEQLGDVVFVELPDVGTRVGQFDKMGEVESVKAVSDIYCPVCGEVDQTNDELLDHPELVNDDPYDKGWMIRLAGVNENDVDGLLTAEEYETYLSQLE